MRTINFDNKWKRIGHGAFAQYYKMSSRRGIKLMHNEYAPDEKRDARYELQDARQELKLLKKASKSGHAPKGYEVVLVRTNKEGWFRIGIIMEHLDAERVARIGFRTRANFEAKCGGHLTVEEIARNTLLAVGVYHDDLHTANILAKTKNREITKIYVVDFTPECVHITKRQKVVFK